MKNLLRLLPFIFLSPLAQAQTPTAEQSAMIDEIFTAFKGAVAPGTPMKRPVFGKDHGCLKGDFVIEPNLGNLAVGVFKGKSYPAWIRFSNDGAAASADNQKPFVARGMAIKLVGVPGAKILAGEETAVTQDFILENHPIFFVDDLQGFRDLTVMSEDEFNQTHPESKPIFAAMGANVLADPLDGTYWSALPYKFGASAVKYKVEPCTPAADPSTKPMTDPNFLRLNLAQHNQQTATCFKFSIQVQSNETEMPTDKATVEWKSPFVPLATLTIPKGQNIEGRKSLCENISMNPWHSLPEHAPLGSISLARRAVYQQMAKYRRTTNHAPQVEPKKIGVNE